MNEQTGKDDALALKPGAICIYRDDFDQDLRTLRNDIHFFPVPFQKLVEKAYPPDKADKSYQEKLRKVINMVYVGVLASVCQIEFEAVEARHSPRVSRPQGQGRRGEHQRGPNRL